MLNSLFAVVPFTQYDEFAMITIYILSGLLGLVIGSFLNVVIYRVPENMSISMPPSHCPNCNYKLRWYDNIPVLSYIMLGGKCRSCKQHISFRYTVVEILNCVLWLLCTLMFIDSKVGGYIAGKMDMNMLPYGIICMIACSVLLCAACVDLEHTWIPDRFQIILGCLGIATIIFNLCGYDKALGLNWYDHVIGGVGAFALFCIIYYGCILVIKREGMGFGDVKLVGVTGLIIGWKNMILAILIAAVLAAIVLVVVRRVKNDEKNHEYPFGPFLAVGILVAMFFGTTIINAYLNLFI